MNLGFQKCATCNGKLGVVKNKPRNCSTCHKHFCKKCILLHNHDGTPAVTPAQPISPVSPPSHSPTPSQPSPQPIPSPTVAVRAVKLILPQSIGGHLTLKAQNDTTALMAKESAMKQLLAKRAGGGDAPRVDQYILSVSSDPSGEISDRSVLPTEYKELHLIEKFVHKKSVSERDYVPTGTVTPTVTPPSNDFPRSEASFALPSFSNTTSKPSSGSTSSLSPPTPTASSSSAADSKALTAANIQLADLQSRYDGLVESHQKMATRIEGLEKAEKEIKKLKFEAEKYKKLSEETSSVKADMTLLEEKLRLQIKNTKRMEDEFDQFVKFYEDDGTMVIENLDDTSAINQKIDELLIVVRRAQGAGSSGGETACFLCATGFGATKWRHECQMCKETFCYECCSARPQLEGPSHKLCVTCVAAVLSIERAKRMRKKLPKEKELANARVNERKKFTELAQVRKEGKLADNKVTYIVATEWLDAWKKFTEGGPRPGPINNRNLIRDDGEPRQNLEAVKDYRGLNSREWSAFYDWYGGGPTIRREKCDIYSPPVRPKATDLALSDRTKNVRGIKQKGDVPKRADGAEKKQEEEILAAMATIGGLPVFALITDQRIKRLHGFNDKAFNKLQHETKLALDIKEHPDIAPPSSRPSEVKNHDDGEGNNEEQKRSSSTILGTNDDPLKNSSPAEGGALLNTEHDEEEENGGGVGTIGSIN